ncbi:MAG: hypothetical protein K0Q72_2447 [Armatimonadetes bacterium]|nr:hypothetical protein [Armatimonadota bacterium]
MNGDLCIPKKRRQFEGRSLVVLIFSRRLRTDTVQRENDSIRLRHLLAADVGKDWDQILDVGAARTEEINISGWTVRITNPQLE